MSKLALKSDPGVSRFAGGRRVRSALAALLIGPGLSGCILGSERPELNLEVPAGYREASRSAPDAAIPAMDSESDSFFFSCFLVLANKRYS